MAKHTIRITGPGIHGMPTDDNPTGEYPIGFEFETDADLPEGWKGRAVIVGEAPADDAEFIVNDDDDDSEVAQARREVIEKAQAHIDELKATHATDLQAVTERAETAEAALAAANKHIDELKAKIASFDHDGDGKPGGAANASGEAATADEIVAAVGLLDAKKADHWTQAGLPAVEAVAEITGKTVTRAAIEAAAPDSKRPTE